MVQKIKVTVVYEGEEKSGLAPNLLFAISCMAISAMVFLVVCIIRQHDLQTIVNISPSYMYDLMDSVARFKMGLFISQIFAGLSGISFVSYLINQHSERT